jgi:hypothetical protein
MVRVSGCARSAKKGRSSAGADIRAAGPRDTVAGEAEVADGREAVDGDWITAPATTSFSFTIAATVMGSTTTPHQLTSSASASRIPNATAPSKKTNHRKPFGVTY